MALNHAKGFMSVEQSIKSKTSQAITSGNKAVIMMYHPGNRHNAFDMQIAEPMFEFVIVYQFQLPSTLLNGTAVLVTWQIFFI